MTFRNRKHIALEDLMFYDNEQLCVEMQAWSDAEDWHYIIPFTVCGEDWTGADEWQLVLSEELRSLGADEGEVVYIEVDF